jgi:inorganic pyrophosphatase
MMRLLAGLLRQDQERHRATFNSIQFFGLLAFAVLPAAAEFRLSKLEVKANSTAGELTQYHYFYDGVHVSPWHDIPFVASQAAGDETFLHFVCEIPKGTTAKNEIHKSVGFNPVMQDVDKQGKPRHYQYSPSLVNYGAIAQTWEDPDAISSETGFGGDNDPVDVLQLNSLPCDVGEVMPVRVLGCLALVDDDETDWKLIVTDARGPDDVGRGNAATHADHAKLAAYRDIEDGEKRCSSFFLSTNHGTCLEFFVYFFLLTRRIISPPGPNNDPLARSRSAEEQGRRAAGVVSAVQNSGGERGEQVRARRESDGGGIRAEGRTAHTRHVEGPRVHHPGLGRCRRRRHRCRRVRAAATVLLREERPLLGGLGAWALEPAAGRLHRGRALAD